MRFLFIAVLSLAAWLGPASVSAEQVQSPLVVTAVSIWAAPLTPGTELDASDPGALDHASALLQFTSFIYVEAVPSERFGSAYSGLVESYSRETSVPIQEVDIPQYNLGSRAMRITSNGFLYEVLMSYDQQFVYIFTAMQRESSQPQMPVLTRVADQLFDPARPDYSTAAMQIVLKEYAPPAEGPSEALLAGLPQRPEVPAEYQLLDEEVIIT
jgi:hypothetical protein